MRTFKGKGNSKTYTEVWSDSTGCLLSLDSSEYRFWSSNSQLETYYEEIKEPRKTSKYWIPVVEQSDGSVFLSFSTISSDREVARRDASYFHPTCKVIDVIPIQWVEKV